MLGHDQEKAAKKVVRKSTNFLRDATLELFLLVLVSFPIVSIGIDVSRLG